MTRKLTYEGLETRVKELEEEATEHKRMEVFFESGQQWRSLLENCPSYIAVADRDGNIQYINRTARGITREEVIGKNIDDFKSPVYHEISRNAIKKVFQYGESGTYQVEALGQDKTTAWFEVHFGPIKRDGQVVAIAFSAIDITLRKQAEERLEAREEFFRVLTENSSDGVVVLDADARIIYTGPSNRDILGRAETERKERSFADNVHPDDLPRLLDAFARLRDNPGDQVLVEFRTQHIDGNWLTLQAAARNLLDNPSAEGIVVNFHDVTELRRSEEEKTRLQEALQHAQKMEAIGTLAGGIAHDFNNILTGILANISMARRFGEHKDDIHQMLADAENASLKAMKLTQQLLTFARGGEPIRKPVCAKTIIEDTARLTLSGSNVKCEYSMSDDLWFIEAEETQIAQVVQNLVVNADQAMPEGGILRIRAENVILGEKKHRNNANGKHVRITVEDEGVGIPRELLSRIFDPFFSTKEKGRGLGLSTVYSIVNRHGGYLEVDSQIGVGTTFDVYLPATEKTAPRQEKARPRNLTGEGKILFVDDEEIVRNSARAVLERLGYEVEFAENGTEGLRLYHEAMTGRRPFDAVIMDLMIPGGMGGREAIKEFRKMDRHAKVIVASGYSDDPVLSRFEEYGFVGALRKPFKMEEIGEVLHEVMMEVDG